jgi:hypothetical protein
LSDLLPSFDARRGATSLRHGGGGEARGDAAAPIVSEHTVVDDDDGEEEYTGDEEDEEDAQRSLVTMRVQSVHVTIQAINLCTHACPQ